jgi:hypothetical protein
LHQPNRNAGDTAAVGHPVKDLGDFTALHFLMTGNAQMDKRGGFRSARILESDGPF